MSAQIVVITMAKTYIDIVKYMVEAKFDISGVVDKPDIIGAIFGQTEGLLGSDLDLRELQKSGKIGRIEIESTSLGNKTSGRLLLPSSLGRVETCILGAAIESVDRVGPFDTSFKVLKVEDTRSEKRNKIVNRAKDLLKNLLTVEMPDSRELSELVEADVKLSTITVYGRDSLPAGPDVGTSDEVVLVEGRADVITLLKNDITNCVAIGGASGTIPQTIIDLCRSKDVTLFLDGDRGGDMILKNLTSVIPDIDYVARAPDGKEVEELTRKEIIKSIRSKVPMDQVHHKKPMQQEREDSQRHDREPRHNRYGSESPSTQEPFRGAARQPRPPEGSNYERESHDLRQERAPFGYRSTEREGQDRRYEREGNESQPQRDSRSRMPSARESRDYSQEAGRESSGRISEREQSDRMPGRENQDHRQEREVHDRTIETDDRQEKPERGANRFSRSIRPGNAEPILSPTDIAHRMEGKRLSRPSIIDEVAAEISGTDESGDIGSIPLITPKADAKPAEMDKFVAAMGDLKNTLRGRLYNSSGDVISEIPIRELIQAVQDTPGVYAIVFDGIITQRLVELSNRREVKVICGLRASQLSKSYDMVLYTAEKGRI